MSKKAMNLKEILAELEKGGINYSFTAIMPNGAPVYAFRAEPPTLEAAGVLIGHVIGNVCMHLLHSGNDENSIRALFIDLVNFGIKEYKEHGAPVNQAAEKETLS
jgi:hypothetical protein